MTSLDRYRHLKAPTGDKEVLSSLFTKERELKAYSRNVEFQATKCGCPVMEYEMKIEADNARRELERHRRFIKIYMI